MELPDSLDIVNAVGLFHDIYHITLVTRANILQIPKRHENKNGCILELVTANRN